MAYSFDDLFGDYTGGSDVVTDFLSPIDGVDVGTGTSDLVGDTGDGGFGNNFDLPDFGPTDDGRGQYNFTTGTFEDGSSPGGEEYTPGMVDQVMGWFGNLPASVQAALVSGLGAGIAGISNSRTAAANNAAADARAAQQGLISKEVMQMRIDQENKARKEDWDRRVESYSGGPVTFGVLGPDQANIPQIFDDRFRTGQVIGQPRTGT